MQEVSIIVDDIVYYDTRYVGTSRLQQEGTDGRLDCLDTKEICKKLCYLSSIYGVGVEL